MGGSDYILSNTNLRRSFVRGGVFWCLFSLFIVKNGESLAIFDGYADLLPVLKFSFVAVSLCYLRLKNVYNWGLGWPLNQN